jgi:hypothetical protein
MPGRNEANMDRTRKVARTLAVLAAVGGLGTLGSLSAFTSQASNPSNRVASGTVTLADNDGGVALYDITNAKPGDSQTACVRVSYSGSLPANVKLYTPDTIGALGPQVNLKIEPGTQVVPSFPSCAAFVADGAAIFDAALSTFPTSYGAGVADFPGTTSAWANGDAVVYRITATLSASAPDAAQGATTGLHAIRWEAQNQ